MLIAPICTNEMVNPILNSLSGACQRLAEGAVAAGRAPSDPLQCPCFLQVPQATAAQFNCLAMPSDNYTVAQTWARCSTAGDLPVCSNATIDPILSKLTDSCQTLVEESILHDEAPSDEMQCPCFMQVPEGEAAKFNCLGLPTDNHTMYQTWARCKAKGFAAPTPKLMAPVCANSTLDPVLRKLSNVCQELVEHALEEGKSPVDALQCPCFLQVPQATAAQFNCVGLPTDNQTLFQTWSRCKTSGPHPSPSPVPK